MKLIDKAAVVAEIERMMAEEMALFEESLKDDSHEISAAPVVYTRLQMLLSAINTIEVKDVDLDEEIQRILDEHFFYPEEEDELKEVPKLIRYVAKHFFELGLSVNNPITASDRGTAEEIIISLKQVENDYHIDHTKEIEWVRNKVKKG